MLNHQITEKKPWKSKKIGKTLKKKFQTIFPEKSLMGKATFSANSAKKTQLLSLAKKNI